MDSGFIFRFDVKEFNSLYENLMAARNPNIGSGFLRIDNVPKWGECIRLNVNKIMWIKTI
jgi:hypothetical protein